MLRLNNKIWPKQMLTKLLIRHRQMLIFLHLTQLKVLMFVHLTQPKTLILPRSTQLKVLIWHRQNFTIEIRCPDLISIRDEVQKKASSQMKTMIVMFDRFA